jgi:outer membrane immunogenic protein
MNSYLKSSVSAAALSLFLAAPAFAADVYNGGLKDSPSADVFEAPTVVNWTGIYIGGQIGVINSNHDTALSVYDPKTSLDIATLDGINASGLLGGGRVGFDIARGRFLFGVFGEYNFSNASADASILAGGTIAKPLYDTAEIEKDNDWSVGARAGLIVAPRTLAYVMAAYTQADYNVSAHDTKGKSVYDKDVTFDGVSVGGGVEFAVSNNIFLGMEYAHTFYGEENLFDNGKAGSGIRISDSLDEDRVMATLKLKLNTGLGW